MESYCLGLINALENENQILERLVELAVAKKEHLILGQVKELEKLVRTEGIVISELGKWEDARFQLQKRLAKALPDQFPMKMEQLQSLLQRSYPHLVRRLQEVVRGLTLNLEHINRLNQHNNELLEQSLDHIAFLETVLIGNHSGAYSPDGLQPAVGPSPISLLDRKV